MSTFPQSQIHWVVVLETAILKGSDVRNMGGLEDIVHVLEYYCHTAHLQFTLVLRRWPYPCEALVSAVFRRDTIGTHACHTNGLLSTAWGLRWV